MVKGLYSKPPPISITKIPKTISSKGFRAFVADVAGKKSYVPRAARTKLKEEQLARGLALGAGGYVSKSQVIKAGAALKNAGMAREEMSISDIRKKYEHIAKIERWQKYKKGKLKKHMGELNKEEWEEQRKTEEAAEKKKNRTKKTREEMIKEVDMEKARKRMSQASGETDILFGREKKTRKMKPKGRDAIDKIMDKTNESSEEAGSKFKSGWVPDKSGASDKKEEGDSGPPALLNI